MYIEVVKLLSEELRHFSNEFFKVLSFFSFTWVLKNSQTQKPKMYIVVVKILSEELRDFSSEYFEILPDLCLSKMESVFVDLNPKTHPVIKLR